MASVYSTRLFARAKHPPVRPVRRRKLTRTEWGKQHTWCWVCGATSRLHCHEICRGPARAAAVKDPASWVRVCQDCHDALGDYSEWPIVRQCALKLSRDAIHFDLDAINRLRSRAHTAIEPWEVDDAACSIDPVASYRLDPFC